MLEILNLSFEYPSYRVFDNLNLTFETGGIHLLAGPTGSGKTTLLEILAGSTPLFTGGELSGSAFYEGINLLTLNQKERLELIGYVGQNPDDTFVSQIVYDEIAFSLQIQHQQPTVVRSKVFEIAKRFGISNLLERELETLSAGQKQRVAIAAALTLSPKLLLLDEPTSALDSIMTREFLGLLSRISYDKEITILVSEHRTDRLLQYVKSVTMLDLKQTFEPQQSLPHLSTPSIFLELQAYDSQHEDMTFNQHFASLFTHAPTSMSFQSRNQHDALHVRNLSLRIDEEPILSDIDATFTSGSLTALIGENGAGKTTFIHTLIGDFKPTHGEVIFNHIPTHQLRGKELLRNFGIVPSNPQDLFLSQSVAADCKISDADRGLPSGSTLNFFLELMPGVDPASHPRDLSAGQQLALALAIALSSSPSVLLLDEPTRGLDGTTKMKLISELQRRRDEGVCIVLATHDIELVAELADQIIHVNEGRIVKVGTPEQILLPGTAFTTLITEIFSPLPVLRTSDLKNVFERV
jgi:energy-coupling factor transport system ATP-binding protein